MHSVSLFLAALAASLASQANAVSMSTSMRRTMASPISKVVKMLKNMEAKINAEGEKADKMFEKIMCNCRESRASLESSIKAAEKQLPDVLSSIKEVKAHKSQLDQEITNHKAERKEARDALETAKSLRSKDEAEFLKESEELTANTNSLTEAITALESGQGSSFLQSGDVSTVRSLSVSMDMSTNDRDLISSFLSGGSQDSGEILGILKAMKDEMSKDLATIKKDNKDAKANHGSLVAAKKKEISAAQRAIEDKTGRVGKLAVEVATLSNNAEDTAQRLKDDKTFLGELLKSCKAQQAEHEEYKKNQAQELVAIGETVKILNDDDARELLSKTLPGDGAASGSSFASVSFAQLPEPAKERRKKAARILLRTRKRASLHDPRLMLVTMALRGNKDALAEVSAKVDSLIALLKKEQADDEIKKGFCETELDKVEDQQKATSRALKDKQTVVAEIKDELASVKYDIAMLASGIRQLDKQVGEQTTVRKQQHKDMVEELAANNAASELLRMAKRRLQQFYGNGGSGGASFAQASAEGADRAKGASNVLNMLDMLIGDINTQNKVLEMEEAEAQKDYETFVKDSQEKRAVDAKAIGDKEGEQAELESGMHQGKVSAKKLMDLLEDTTKELGGLHAECDWLLKNFQLRGKARAEEIDGLTRVKAVIAGAKY